LAKIILVRHGETEWNRVHRLQGGGSDNPLNETGKQQAAKVALRLKDEKIQAVYSSPLQRAAFTAQEIARYHQLEVTLLPALKEIEIGKLEGVFSATLPQRFDEFICRDRHLLDPDNHPGESIAAVQARAWDAVRDIAARNPGGTLVVVSHYFVIMTLVCQVLGLPLEQLSRLKSSPGTITAFTMDGQDNTSLELFNDGYYPL
jgi:probable phosphoglycerate mutase